MYSALQNIPIVMNLLQAANYTGWSISADGSTAIHSSCQQGLATLISYPVLAGNIYKVSYSVPAITSGYVQMQAGGTNGAMRTTANIYIETIVPATNGFIQFFSNGNCEVSLFNAANITNQIGTTIVWSALNRKWSDFRQQYPDFGWSIYTKTVIGKDGDLYSAQNGSVGGRNNFFGTQYQTVFGFVENKEPELLKSYNSVVLQSNQLMVSNGNGIKTSLGQISNLIEQDFLKSFLSDTVTTANVYEVVGTFSASFQKDINSAGGIINGDALAGNYIMIELVTVDGSVPLKLFSVAVNASRNFIGAR